MSELPSGWAAAPLWDLGESIKGSVQPAATNTFELYSVPSFADAEPEVVRGSEIGSHKRPVLPGDLLICKINPRINRVWLVGVRSEHDQLASPEWLVLRTPSPELTRLLVYQLSAPGFRQWIERGVHGVTGSHTRAKDGHVLDFVARIPPREEQRRIVAAIEEAFSKLDAGEAGLRNVRQLLKRMRDAVLAAAVTGRLVPQDPTDTPATKLLVGLGVVAYDEPSMPDGWSRATVGDLLDRIEAGKSFAALGRPAEAGEVGVIKVSAMTWGEFGPDENKAIPDGAVIDERWRIRGGDLLFSRANTSEYVGACVLVPNDFPQLILSDKSLRLVPHDEIDVAWLLTFLRSRPARAQIEVLATGTKESMRNISQAKLRQMDVPVPPPQEQTRIASEVDRQMSFIEACERSVDAGLEKAAALRRSVLRAAFEGRLVPQDPNDEPASVLLERIRAERAAAPKPSRRRKKATS